ncbi:ATP-binding protein [Xylanimonas ulmi]|uniref:histidine kinase n=1 Tax=Xylanimonas ulmi TaxID=228973 RepID=A0A4Q7LZV5_9MICO|nr:ATP-binding protein [Xylanibacterium ulmi]RZS60371.1 signal transduction histidine kinase [Xylanibacterium ulmi]
MSFRARLTALIASVFVLGGAALLGVQFLLVQHLLEQQVDERVVTTPVEITTAPAPTAPSSSSEAITAWHCPPATTGHLIDTHDGWWWIECVSADGATVLRGAVDPDASPQERAATVQQLIHESTTLTTTRVSREVLRGLVVWSVVILAAFTGLAVLAARWLSRRSLGRVARITATTRAIGVEGLDRRLALAGPRDEIRELGDTIDSMLDRLEDAFERQDRFIAGASHELRTPLTTTRTLLEIPLTQGRVPADLVPSVRGALDANERSERLVGALLTLARSRTPASLAAGETDLGALAARILAERSDAAEARGLRVSPPAGDDAIAAVAPDLTLLALGNLFDNAIRHNADGGALAVRTGRDEPAGRVWVEVVNDGADLTGADVEALTEPFHRGTASRLAGEGLGLGLALVDTVATASGGALSLAARPGGGLRARLTLPARRDQLTATPG